MAENPRFNNSDMFKGVSSNDYSDIEPNSTSEVLATQGNVINSIKVFWNKLRAKLAYAVTRPNTTDAVGGHYQPVYVNNSGDVAPCSPSVFQTTVNSSTINLPEDFPIYAGQVICFNVTNGSGDNSGDLKIGNISVYYPTGATVKGSDVIGGSYLFTYISGNGDKWILNNKINVVSSNNDGLMTVAEHNKLDGIDEGANAYSLPTASDTVKGGVKSSNNTTNDNLLKRYHVNVNRDGVMTVDVPWQNTQEANWVTDLKVGQETTTSNDTTAATDATYMKVVENGAVHGKVKVVGSGSVQVSSTKAGELEIYGAPSHNYTTLKTDKDNANNDNETGYLVLGPGSAAADTKYYLRGDGSWGQLKAEVGFSTGSSLLITNNSSPSGNFRLCYAANNSVFNCLFILPDGTMQVSNRCSLPTLSPDTHTITITYIPIQQTFPDKGILLPGRAQITVRYPGTANATLVTTIL